MRAISKKQMELGTNCRLSESLIGALGSFGHKGYFYLW